MKFSHFQCKYAILDVCQLPSECFQFQAYPPALPDVQFFVAENSMNNQITNLLCVSKAIVGFSCKETFSNGPDDVGRWQRGGTFFLLFFFFSYRGPLLDWSGQIMLYLQKTLNSKKFAKRDTRPLRGLDLTHKCVWCL